MKYICIINNFLKLKNMKKYIILLLIIIINISSFFAKDISVSQAITAANTYFNYSKKVPSNNLNPFVAKESAYFDKYRHKHIAFYVIDMSNNNGFVIVSGTDKTIPILGYVDHGHYDEAKIPAGLKKLMFNYNKEIKQITRNKDIKSTTSIKQKWTDLLSGNMYQVKASSVNPLLTTTWGQSTGGYNTLCPSGTPAGCVATATAQIMKYHNHPMQGSGSNSYNHNNYGTLSANFGATQYDWNNMPNSLNSSSSQTQIDAISTLMYHIGVSIDMNYSPGNSGAFSRDVPDALIDNFSYNSNAEFIKRSYFTLAVWKGKIKNELNQNKVVYHSGFCSNPQAGHAFIIDGFNNSDLFHLNWGWGGSADGYFEINNLNPGSTYTFNDTQSAIIKIEPVTSNSDIRMFGNMSLSTSNLMFSDPLTIDVDVANYGNMSFSGNFRAALYSTNGAFVNEIDVENFINISSNNYTSLTFSTSGLYTPPGTYNLGIYYQDLFGTWTLVTEDGHTNPISVNINGLNPQGLISNGNIIVNPDPIEQNDPFQVEFEILNNNSSSFSGDISIDLHEIDGTWIKEVDHSYYTIPSNGTQNIVFNHTGFGDTPGSYKLMIWHKVTGGSWDLIQNGTYPNSITIDIVGLNYANIPDIYENNNTQASAFQVPMNFSQNIMTYNTNGANIHSVTADSNDYYSFSLDPGYNYKIYSRVHDNYNSQLGLYSNDVIFKVNENGYWSNFYDDIEMDTVSIFGITTTQKFYIDVVPFFYNQLGTYDLEVYIKRIPGSVNIKDKEDNYLVIYPNPAKDILNINFNESHPSLIQVLDINGKLINQIDVIDSKNASICISSYKSGIYFLKVQTKTGLVHKYFEVIK